MRKLNNNGTQITTWGTHGSGTGQFDFPKGIAVDSAGDVYVADTGNDRVQKFDGNGGFITSWGTHGQGPNQFVQPTAFDFDTSGNVFVVDGATIQKFKNDGTFLSRLPRQASDAPFAITHDDRGNMYVTYEFSGLVRKITPDGLNLVSVWGGPGNWKRPIREWLRTSWNTS